MNKLERIKLKINSLLQKTTENGSSESEMFSALKKAEELMRKYSIHKSEIEKVEKKKKEKCVLKSTPKFKSGFNTTLFLHSLSNLFDCEHYYTKSEVYFFGYEEDVKLCIYFYDLILKVCFKEKNQFLKSEKGIDLKIHSHPKSISSNFIKGFLTRVSQRLNLMYKEKKEESNQNERGLMLIKKSNVEEEFKELNIPINVVKFNLIVSNEISYNEGVNRGELILLSQGLENDKTNTQLIKN